MKTASESLFESYLAALCVEYDYEPCMGGRNPDYGIVGDSPGSYQAVIEVKELEWPRSVPKPVAGSVTVRGVDSYTPVREKINVAARQFRGAKHLPCLIVLYDLDHFYGLNEHVVFGAMLGDLTIQVPIVAWPGQPVSAEVEDRVIFGRGGKMRLGGQIMNTTISAIAVLETEYVEQHRCGFAAEVRATKLTGESMEEAYGKVSTIYDKYMSRGCDLERRELRLRIHRNPYARLAWPDSLSTPFDDVWGPDSYGYIVKLVDGLRPASTGPDSTSSATFERAEPLTPADCGFVS